MKNLIPILFITTAFISCNLLGGGDKLPDIPGKIVFAAKDDEGTSQIYTMKADGSDVKQFTHFDASEGAYQPSWSPDGQRIAFTSDRDYAEAGSGRYRQDLYVMNADGTGLKKLTRDKFVASMAWRPAGNTIFLLLRMDYTNMNSTKML